MCIRDSLIGGEARRLLHGPQGVLQPAGVVGLQLRRPLPQVPGLRPVGGIQLRCVQSGRPVQTAEIVPQRVLHSLPAADVGRDVKQHMVAAEQPPAGRVIQAQVPRRVARRQHAPQHTAAVMERRAVLQLRIESFPPGRGRRLGRIVSPQGLHLRLGEAVPHIFPVKPLPTGRIRGVFHAGAVDLPDIDPAAGADQLRRQPCVVAVEVGAENVQPVPVHVRLRQLALHGLAAGPVSYTHLDVYKRQLLVDCELHVPAHHHAGQLFTAGLGDVHRADVFALPQDRAAVRHGHDLIQLVGDEQDGFALCRQVLHDLHQLVDLLRCV